MSHLHVQICDLFDEGSLAHTSHSHNSNQDIIFLEQRRRFSRACLPKTFERTRNAARRLLVLIALAPPPVKQYDELTFSLRLL